MSSNGGQAPLWAHSGKELFYVDGGRSMVAVPITGGASMTIGTERTLFPFPASIYLAPDEHYTPFDISPDDQRFLMARQIESSASEQVTVLLVENWLAEAQSKLMRK